MNNLNLHQACSRKRKHEEYKVVIEAVPQKKQKLQVSITYNTTPPQGYVFVPAGLARLTIRCKEVCRLRDLPIQIISAENSSSNDPMKVSHHIHRIGYHFPSSVVETACGKEGYRVWNGKLEDTSLSADECKRSRNKNGRHNNGDNNNNAEKRRIPQPLDTHSMAVSREQVVKSIRDLFPCIPIHDAYSISRHSFREGTARVGNCSDLPLARRIQLAVLAHIRHVYTNYDTLLTVHPYLKARAMVENECLRTLIKWRGEDDFNSNETEEIFREIIVLDDPEEEEKEAGDVESADRGIQEPTIALSSQTSRTTNLNAEEANGEEVSHGDGEDDSEYSPSHISFTSTSPTCSLGDSEPSVCSFRDVGGLDENRFNNVSQIDRQEAFPHSSLSLARNSELFVPDSSGEQLCQPPSFDFNRISRVKWGGLQQKEGQNGRFTRLSPPDHSSSYHHKIGSVSSDYVCYGMSKHSSQTCPEDSRAACPTRLSGSHRIPTYLRVRKVPSHRKAPYVYSMLPLYQEQKPGLDISRRPIWAVWPTLRRSVASPNGCTYPSHPSVPISIPSYTRVWKR